MFPSIAAVRASRIVFIRGRPYRTTTKAITAKMTSDQARSGSSGSSGPSDEFPPELVPAIRMAPPMTSPFEKVAGGSAEDEAGGDADEGERLGEGDTDEHLRG